MIIITSGDKVHNSVLSKSPHKTNFTEGWHWHEENAVTRALEISQSLMSIKYDCSNVIFSNYYQSLGKLLNTIACIQPCWPEKLGMSSTSVFEAYCAKWDLFNSFRINKVWLFWWENRWGFEQYLWNKGGGYTWEWSLAWAGVKWFTQELRGYQCWHTFLAQDFSLSLPSLN